MRRALFSVVLLAAGIGAAAGGQIDIDRGTGCFPAPRDLRSTAQQLRTKLPDDEFFAALDRAAGVRYSDQLAKGFIPITQSDELSILIMPPYWAYRFDVLKALLSDSTWDPLEEGWVGRLAVSPGIEVHVSPTTMTSADIVRVVVKRDARTIAPLVTSLEPQPVMTRLGATAMLHQGTVLFPCSAFLPDARVTVTAIPASGRPFTRTLTRDELAAMTGVPRAR